MNKNLHRVIFNKARGIRMVVQEIASSEGKASSGSTETGGSGNASTDEVNLTASSLTGLSHPAIAAAAKTAGALALAFGAQASFAQIIADPSAPNRQRPTVLESANGIPTVNIQTPSAAGVSRNTYQQFDIGQKGAILNNSRTNVQTQIGGWVQGNPWLANGGARVIVNEVNSAAQTRLMGPLEVAGQRADVIIANPSGLVVDGLSFINAAGVTLTTGRPLYGVNGAVDGFNVQGGLINIQGNGLDATKADYANILARAILLNAGLWAQDLRVVTGVNQIAANGSVQQSNPSAAGAEAAKPQFALDVAQLGGMYAGKIFIVGTESGLGVRNAGTLSATSGGLTLSADGQLSNSGVLASNHADANLNISSKGVDNSGTLSSQRDITINDGGAGFSNSGTIQATQQLQVQAAQLSNQSTGSVTAQRLDLVATELSNDGSITQTGSQDLRIQSAVLTNSGTKAVLGLPPAEPHGSGGETGTGSEGNSSSTTPPTSGQDGSSVQTTPVVPVVLATGNINVMQGITNAGKIIANGATDVSTSQSLSNSGNINIRQLHSEGSLDNSQGNLVAQNFSGSQTSFLNRSGSLSVQTDLKLDVKSLDNSAGMIGSAQSLSINAGESVQNTAGTLTAGKDLTVTAQTVGNDSGRIVSNAGSVSLDTSGALSNRKGQIGTASTAQDAQVGIQAQSLDNNQGEISQNGSGQLRIQVAGGLQSNQGLIASSGSTQINAASLSNDTGNISALQHLDIVTSQGISNVAGNIQAGDGSTSNVSNGSLKIQSGGDVDNRSGTLFANATLNAQAANIDNRQGSMTTMGDMQMHTSNGLSNNAGKIQANGNVDIQSTQRIGNQSGVIASGGMLNLQTQDLQSQKGQISAGKDATLMSQTLDNTEGSITQASQGKLSLIASNALTNAAGKIVSNGDLNVLAGQTNNQNGELTSLNNAQIQVANLQGEQGLIQSGAALNLHSDSDINSRKGTIQSQGPLTIDVKGQLTNADGKILSSGLASIQSAGLDNTSGALSSTDSVQIKTAALINDQGTIAANNTATINSTSLSNQAGQIGAQTIAIDAQQGALNNDGGKIIASTGNLDVQSGALHNDQGWLQAAQDLQINTHGQSLTNTGTVLALGNATINSGDLNNTSGTIQAGASSASTSKLNLQSGGTITNKAGYLLASSDIDIHSQNLNNAAGEIGAGGQLSVMTQSNVSNAAGKLVGNTGVTLNSTNLTNTQQGVIGSSAGNIDIHTGSFNNQTGAVTAKGSAAIVSLGLDNTQGQIGAGSLSIKTQGQQLTNTGGQILASNGNLDVQSGWLDNERGRIAALQNVTLTANGINNDAGRITADSVQIQSKDAAGHWSTVSNQSGTILADQRLQLDSSALNNSAGAIQTTASTSQLQINSHGGDIINQHSGSAGGIVSSGSLQMDAQGASINNSYGGYIGAYGDAQLTGGQVINQGGSITSNDTLQIRSTAGSGVGIDNTAGGSIQSTTNVKLYAQAAEIANSGGSITSNNDVLIQSSGKVNNDQGAIKAGHDLSVIDAGVVTGAALSSASQTLSNQGGTLFAGNNLSIRNQSISGAGSLQSQGGMQLAFAGNYTHQGDLSVNGDLAVESGGDFTNQGRIKGGSSVTVSGNNVDNQSGAEISSAGITTVNANQTLTNRGLIDGSDTRINASTVDNVGTGRIYGDHVSIKADTLNNRAENESSATIASRQDMDIGAFLVNNAGGSTILSLGDMRFGGTLDANRVATGQAQAINNTGSKIDSGGSINMNAVVVNNTNAGIEIAKQEFVGSQAGENLVQLPGRQIESASNYREVEGDVFIPYFKVDSWSSLKNVGIPGARSDGRMFKVAHPDKFLSTLPLAVTGTVKCSGGGDDSYCNTIYEYEAAGSIRFAQYGIAVPEKYNTVEPDPVKYGAYVDPDNGALYWYFGDKAGYEAAIKIYDDSIAAAKKLNDAILAEIKENNRFEDSERKFTVVGGVTDYLYRDRIISSKSGEITAGKNINISGLLNNFDSTVIAAGNIATGNLNSKSTTTGTETKTTNGTAIHYEWKYSGFLSDDYYRLESDPVPYTSSQSTSFELPTVVFLQNQAGAGAGGSVGANGNTGHNASNTGGGASGVGQAVGNSGTIAQQGGQGSAPGNASSGGSVNSGGYNAGGSGSSNAPATVTQQQVTTAAGEQVFIRTVSSGPSLPSSSLYVVNAQNGNRPLVETDPAFASYKNWLSSDYMVNALSLDPALMQKRLGDGFYEQQLIQQQIGQLTGRRFLGDYTSNDAQYQALLQNGVTFAKEHALRPGVELSAAQVAQLTSDLVWLVSQNVTMADGSVQSVLVPKVYVVAKPGDLSATGTLISAESISVKTQGDVYNSGTIAGRKAVVIAANDINNIGGHIVSDSVYLSAGRDINVVGGTVSAALQLLAEANRDINVVTTTRTTTGGTAQNGYSNTVVDRVAGITLAGPLDASSSPGGVMSLSAGKDINIQGAQITNAIDGGITRINAGNNVNLSTVGTSTDSRITWDSKNHLFFGNSQEIGSQINTKGATAINAGNDINARAAQIQTTQDLRLNAGNDVNISAGQASKTLDDAYFVKSSGLFGSSTKTWVDQVQQTQAIGSSIGGAAVGVSAGRDINVVGSNVVSDSGTALQAGRDISIAAAQETFSEQHYRKETASGMFSGGGLGITIGTRQLSTDQQGVTTSAAASTIGSTAGDIQLRAGRNYTQTGSDVIAPQGDINVHAQKVDIVEARETNNNQVETKFKQSGLTIAVTSPVISAIQTAQQMATAANNTGSTRMQALAAANSAFAANNALDAIKAGQGTTINGKEGQIPTGTTNPDGSAGSRDANAADKAGGINLAISIGGSKSDSKTVQTTDSARGSTVVAGKNLNITATGAGQDSDITVQGSSLQAGNQATLSAEDQINLLAAKNTADQHSKNSSLNGSIGFSIGTDGLMFNASASGARGNADGSDVTWSNSQVKAGNQVSLTSGGDTTLKGAVVAASQVKADVGGNLNIESLQDTSKFDSKQQSIGGSISIGYGKMGGSFNASRSTVDSDYQSVIEQSGIKAGDGGFDVNVKGNTDLKGAVIASTQTAVDNGRNQFSTAGTLTTSDLQNRASYDAQSISIGTSGGQQPGKLGINGVGAGVGQDSGSAQSITTAGISGIAGDQSVRTGDATGIERIFDQNKVQREIDAQVAITAEFGKQASKAVGDYAGRKFNELKDSDPVEAAKWSEGGAYRVAMHAVVGGLSGGVQGLMGATAASTAAPYIDQLQEGFQSALQNAGLGEGAAKILASLAGGATAATIGAATSGGSAAGAAMAFNADMNNRQLHPIDKINAKNLSAKSNGKYSVEEIEEQLRLMGTEIGDNRIAPGTIAILKEKADFANNRTVDPSMPLIIDGNVAVEKLGNINIEIQKYILENTLSDAGWIPGNSPYTASNNNSTNNIINGSVIIKSAVNCANLHLTCISGVGTQQGKPFTQDERKALGEYFGGVSTNYARIAALATLGGQPEIAVTYNVASGVAALLEQAYSPSTGKVIIDNSVDAVASEFSRKSGIPYPVVIEVVEREIKPRLESARQALDNTLNGK